MGILVENIKQAHRQAELQRLNAGWQGCGCSDCQTLYKELDLSKYGNRVSYHDSRIDIAYAPWMQPKDHWEGDSVFVHYGKRYIVNALLQTVCKGETGPAGIAGVGEVPMLKIVNPAEACPAWERCNAPLCPLDDQSMRHGVWYSDEEVCSRRGARIVPWVKIQYKVQKKAKRSDFYFTVNDFLTMKSVRKPLGHDPDVKMLISAKNRTDNVPSEKNTRHNRKNETGKQGSFII
jgi:hypothetical protein